MTKSKMKFIFCAPLAFSLLLQPGLSHAAENSFDYPELAVVPRATERIQSEAAQEREQALKTHLPFLVPATMTFVTGVVLKVNGTKTNYVSGTGDTSPGNKYAPWVAMGVGAAWWAVTLGILNNLDYYSDGVAEFSKLPAKTQREQLLRERRAEEAMYRAGAMARRLKWISVASNLGASLYMVSASPDGSFPLYLAAASALTSLSPLLFTHRWETTECLHRDYKKRIYGSLTSITAGPTMLSAPNGQAFVPGLLLSAQF
jgi:hypothetical protein